MGWLDTSVSFGEEVYPYNIRQDITERNDLSDSNPEKLQEMADALSAKLKGYDALMPTFRYTGILYRCLTNLQAGRLFALRIFNRLHRDIEFLDSSLQSLD